MKPNSAVPHRRRRGSTTVVSIATIIVGCSATGTATSSAPEQPGSAVVHRVVDGDTIEVAISGEIHQVRLLGVDAPETVHPTKPEQCFGRQAADGLTEVLPEGSAVTLTRDVEPRDHFDRLLLYVHRHDGLFVNQWLIDKGLADALFYNPNTHHKVAFTRALNEAKANRVGLWGACEGPDQPLP